MENVGGTELKDDSGSRRACAIASAHKRVCTCVDPQILSEMIAFVCTWRGKGAVNVRDTPDSKSAAAPLETR